MSLNFIRTGEYLEIGINRNRQILLFTFEKRKFLMKNPGDFEKIKSSLLYR